jgi:hypothetical protein
MSATDGSSDCDSAQPTNVSGSSPHNRPIPVITSKEKYFEEALIDENDIISTCLLGSISVPTVLRDRQCLRSGKWTKEEEHFAFTIIQHFQTGTLNIPDTATLRQCLSVALNCDAMRISKKFAGPYSIGKQVFLPIDKENPNYEALTRISAEELNVSRSNWFRKLDEIEAAILSRSRKRMRLDSNDLSDKHAMSIVKNQSESADLESFHNAVMGLHSLKQQGRIENDQSTEIQQQQYSHAPWQPTGISLESGSAMVNAVPDPSLVYSMGKILKGDYASSGGIPFPMWAPAPIFVPWSMMTGPPMGYPPGSMNPHDFMPPMNGYKK